VDEKLLLFIVKGLETIDPNELTAVDHFNATAVVPYSLWRKVTGISQEFRMYISRDEALCIPASEFPNFYEFHVPWSAWSEDSTLYAWYSGNFQKDSFFHPVARIQNIFRNFRTSKDAIRVVEHVHKISKAQRPTMRLHG
jgi:hypothetical protein